MLMFCPTCASALIVEEGPLYLRFGCFTCPYVCNIKRIFSSRMYPRLKVGFCEYFEYSEKTSALLWWLCFWFVGRINSQIGLRLRTWSAALRVNSWKVAYYQNMIWALHTYSLSLFKKTVKVCAVLNVGRFWSCTVSTRVG
jgi:hypothetical protein